MSCNDLIFRTNRSLITNHGVDVSIFDKCHRNIIYGKINIRYLSLQCMSERSGIIKQILKILRKEFLTLTGINSFETLKTLLNVFRNYIPKKKIKSDYRQPQWMTDNIKKYLKGRCKLTIFFLQKVRRKLIMIKFWKSLQNALRKFSKLKRTFLKWPKNLPILILLQNRTGLYQTVSFIIKNPNNTTSTCRW